MARVIGRGDGKGDGEGGLDGWCTQVLVCVCVGTERRRLWYS